MIKGSRVMPSIARGLRVPPSEWCQKPYASAVIHSVAQKLLDIRCLTKRKAIHDVRGSCERVRVGQYRRKTLWTFHVVTKCIYQGSLVNVLPVVSSEFCGTLHFPDGSWAFPCKVCGEQKVTLGKFLLPVLPFSPATLIPCTLVAFMLYSLYWQLVASLHKVILFTPLFCVCKSV